MADLGYKTRIRLPQLPNYVHVEGSFVRGEGLAELPKVDIADLPDDTLRAIAAEWRDALIALAVERRQNRNGKATPR